MGLLDDSIREHLELKRRRGADPREVTRQEQEALGPVRREPETATDAEPAALDDEAATELQPVAAEPPPLDGEDPGDPVEAPEPVPLDVPARGPGGSVPAHGLGETEEWGFEDEDEEEDEPGDEEAEPNAEDVLEQTPEFLSETPEHDRLWFEQKPPRDFDFDG